MKPNPETHLSYDEQLIALVDPKDLDSGQQAHLKSCVQCQAEARRVSERFESMGRMARQMAPEPSRPFRLPANERQVGFGFGWRFKPAYAAGILGVLVMVFTLWGPGRFGPDAPGPGQLAQQADEDVLLMAEIDDLVDNALPEAYRELAMVDTPDMPHLTEDLIDWLVPTIEEDEEPIDPTA